MPAPKPPAFEALKRLLTVIDEALANVVENNKVTVANLAQVISYVTPEIRHELPEQLSFADLSIESRSGHDQFP
jgi:chorismate mutase